MRSRFLIDENGRVNFNQKFNLMVDSRVILFCEINDIIWWVKCNRWCSELHIHICFNKIYLEMDMNKIQESDQRQIIITASGNTGFGGCIQHCIGSDEPEKLNTIKSLVVKPNLINYYYKSKSFRAGFIPLTQGVATGTRLRIFNISKRYIDGFGLLGRQTKNGRKGKIINPIVL